MTQSKPPTPVSWAVKLGFVALAASIVAFLWLHDWRLLVVGVLALLLSTVLGAPSKRAQS